VRAVAVEAENDDVLEAKAAVGVAHASVLVAQVDGEPASGVRLLGSAAALAAVACGFFACRFTFCHGEEVRPAAFCSACLRWFSAA
jgi:hypothetical protein